MNDQVVLVFVVIIAVFVLISFVYSKINKTRQGDIEREKLLRIEHEKQVAELKHLLLNKKEKKEQELKALFEKANKDEAKYEILRVGHEKEVAELKILFRIEKENELEKLSQLLRENTILKQEAIQKEKELIQSELRNELTIPIPQRDDNSAIYAEDGEYAAKLLDIDKTNFLTVYNISKWHMIDLINTNPEYAERLREKVKGGLDILTSSDELHEYKFKCDQKHNAKLQSAFNQFVLKAGELNITLRGNLDIIDLGCGQALATFLFIDYLLASGIDNLFINKIILIEPSEIAVKRGVAIINKMMEGTSLHSLIKVVTKKLDQVDVSNLYTYNANVKLHLFSNILDVPGLDIHQIVSVISKSQKNMNYFICVSPNISAEKNTQLDLFFRLFQNEYATIDISKRTSNIPFTLFSGKPGNAERYERMFFSNIVSLDNYSSNFVLIRGGEFAMGSPETEENHPSDEAQHQVKVSDFYMSRYTVTLAEFRRFVEESGYQTDAEKESDSVIDYNIDIDEGEVEVEVVVNWRYGVSYTLRPQIEEKHPVVYVSWNDAVAYCEWLSEKTGTRFRLPTEAEWEYACRAGTITPYNTGKNLTTDQANYNGNYPCNGKLKGLYYENTVAVNSFAPNAWGLYNMHGNVWEWCSDWYDGTYYDDCKKQGAIANPAGLVTGSLRVLRGGGWRDKAWGCRSADRNIGIPNGRSDYVGFRPVFDQSLKDVDRCSQPSPVDTPTGQSSKVTLKRSSEFDSFKQHSKVVRIHGSQGKKTSFEFCSIPVDKSIIDKDFYMGKYPVTQQQWEAVMGNNPSRFKGDSLPVDSVSWDDAQTFIQKLNQLSGKQHYRLPTEEEWEYCCRAGSTSEYYFDDDESQWGGYAWYDGNSGETTHPVGQKKPNRWGLYDMAGNVWEWTDSWYDNSRSPRVIRGGSWCYSAVSCRSATRFNCYPDFRFNYIGFRLVFVP